MFLILNNLFVFCFAPFLDHTEPTQSVTEQNPLILTSTILPGPYPKVVHLLIIVPDTIWHRKSWTSSFWRRIVNKCESPCTDSQALGAWTCSQIMYEICLPRKNRSYFWARCSSTHILFKNWMCELRIFFNADAIITSSISQSGYLFSQELIAMCSIRQLTLLSQLLWSMTSWFEDSLSSHKLQSWNWLSSFQIPWSQGSLQDAAPRLEISGTPSYHRENKFHQYDVKFHLHSGECFSHWISLVAQVSSSILLSSYVL